MKSEFLLDKAEILYGRILEQEVTFQEKGNNQDFFFIGRKLKFYKAGKRVSRNWKN